MVLRIAALPGQLEQETCPDIGPMVCATTDLGGTLASGISDVHWLESRYRRSKSGAEGATQKRTTRGKVAPWSRPSSFARIAL
jgi:hypothetical protein